MKGDLPTIERLQEAFRLDEASGKFYWKIDPAGVPRSGLEAGTTVTNGGYRKGSLDCCELYAHRVVFALKHGRWPTAEIDHINGDPSDNRPCNLREATSAENKLNRRRQSNNRSGWKGVHIRHDGKAWCSQIRHKGKVLTLGSTFKTKEEAAAAYAAASRKIHGEFGRADAGESA